MPLLGAFGSTGLGYTKIIGTLLMRHRGKALALRGAESMRGAWRCRR